MKRKTNSASAPAGSALAPAGDGPLIEVDADGVPRLTRGAYKGKLLGEVPHKALTVLMKQSYRDATDPELLLSEYLSRMLKKPVTSKTAVAALREEWQQTRAKLIALKQSSLSARLLGVMAEKLNEAAEADTCHEANTWPSP